MRKQVKWTHSFHWFIMWPLNYEVFHLTISRFFSITHHHSRGDHGLLSIRPKVKPTNVLPFRVNRPLGSTTYNIFRPYQHTYFQRTHTFALEKIFGATAWYTFPNNSQECKSYRLQWVISYAPISAMSKKPLFEFSTNTSSWPFYFDVFHFISIRPNCWGPKKVTWYRLLSTPKAS